MTKQRLPGYMLQFNSRWSEDTGWEAHQPWSNIDPRVPNVLYVEWENQQYALQTSLESKINVQSSNYTKTLDTWDACSLSILWNPIWSPKGPKFSHWVSESSYRVYTTTTIVEHVTIWHIKWNDSCAATLEALDIYIYIYIYICPRNHSKVKQFQNSTAICCILSFGHSNTMSKQLLLQKQTCSYTNTFTRTRHTWNGFLCHAESFRLNSVGGTIVQQAHPL